MTDTNTQELAKSFDPAAIEARWYPIWEERGYFKAGLDPKKPSFSIQLPPPNSCCNVNSLQKSSAIQ